MSFTNNKSYNFGRFTEIYKKMGEIISNKINADYNRRLKDIFASGLTRKESGIVGVPYRSPIRIFSDKVARGIKKTGGMFKKAGKPGVQAAIGMLLMVLDRVMEMHPVMKILDSLLTYFVAQILLRFMPLIIPLIEILASPEFLALIDAIAECLVAWMYPSFEALLIIIQALAPYIPFVTQLLRDLVPVFSFLGAVLLPMLPIITQIITTIRIVNNLLETFRDDIINIQRTLDRGPMVGSPVIASVGGGGMGIKGSIVKNVASSVGSSLKKMGIGHSGIPSVPETGLYLLQKGERVETSIQNYAKENQIEQMLIMEQENLSYQEKIYKLLKAQSVI